MFLARDDGRDAEGLGEDDAVGLGRLGLVRENELSTSHSAMIRLPRPLNRINNGKKIEK